MMRLIDADAMLETLKRKYPQWYTGKPKDSWMHYAWLVYHQAVENAPAIDAVPVVRCKDCRHWSEMQNLTGACLRHSVIDGSWWTGTDSTDYCSFAERKDDDRQR